MKKNILYLFFIQATNYLFPLITLPYLIRVLGSESFGIYAIVLAIIQYINIIVDFGFNFTSTRLISINSNNKDKINIIYSATMILKIIIFMICLVGIFCYFLFAREMKYLNYIIIGLVGVVGNILLPVWLFQGIGRMDKIALCSTCAKFISLITVFATVKSENDIAFAIASYSIGLLLSGIISIYIIFCNKYVKLVKVETDFIVGLCKNSFDMFISNITISLYTTFNTILAGIMGGPTIAGYFSAADKLRMAVQGLLSPLQQAIFPKVSQLVHDDYSLDSILKSYGFKMMFFGLFLSIGTALIGVPFSRIYFGSSNDVSSNILLILSPLPFIVAVGVVFGQWWLIAKNLTKIIRAIYLSASFIHIAIAYSLMYFIPGYGVAISVVITELSISILLVLFALKHKIV
ncbi:oligosaccharide flippase family protein [Citrobacter portucalensis]|uniref:oligosaccharide flippase family protein n=1 Tax=Citrobacter TaxID=544 RepID=UPI00129A8B9E|nr:MULTISPECIES: oligosaccharide flippase family protein [Citrobacter]MBW7618012.1 oligosaccharide flippase family protein [Citrobacter portucalensis]MBW7637232.1 oligosaccharide flippase family protein [Citrobacter portucalensis]MCA2131317.1 oligosaccharide flippase family protein [Citrobacter portucalensis]MCA2141496.1 oligosaccharide flippase family protein [Citrobacter portucalensis]MCA2147081.1 oligosaccharide flippase family protein [Citrobacter portucalensis]